MIVDIAANFFKILKPISKLTVSEWADKYRYLSPEDSSVTGKWYTSVAEYQRGILDAFTDPEVETVVVMCSAQTGKTQSLLNVIGYYTDQEPAPILLVLPTEAIAKDFSKTRITPMIRDTPVLSKIFGRRKSRSTGNTVLSKEFPGGRMVLVGSNAPSGLASRPIRIVLMDEVGRYESTKEGDPIELARKRTKTFFNRKIGMFSTPGIEGQCRIAKWYDNSDMRKYYVPCPYCGTYQFLKWQNLRWKKKDNLPVKGSVKYECESCRKFIPHKEKSKMIANGYWKAEKELNKIAGFWINELSSPWSTWQEMAEEFFAAKKDREKLREFVNLSLGETWTEEGIGVEYESLYDWREDYGKNIDVPAGGLVLVGGVDIQDDRIEGEIVAYGVGQESWGIDHFVIHGNPSLKTTWDDVERQLKKVYRHESGAEMAASCVAFDSGGHYTTDVYFFTKKFEIMRWFSVKGSSLVGKPIVPSKPSKVGRLQNKLFMVGTDTAKQLIFNRLLMTDEAGPGKMHFPMKYSEDYFKQLTAEKAIYKKDAAGYTYRKWKKIRARNEALDIRVYSLAAIGILNPNFELLSKRGPVQAIKSEAQKPRRRRNPGVKL